MAFIKVLKDSNDNTIYPQSLTSAVIDSNGNNLDALHQRFITATTVEENIGDVRANYEKITNKVTSISKYSTDVEYPSAKSVYEAIESKTSGNIKIAIAASKESIIEPDTTTLYLIGSKSPYEEYLYLENGDWELIGSTFIEKDIPKFIGTLENPIDFSNLFEEIGNPVNGWYPYNKSGYCILEGYIKVMNQIEPSLIKDLFLMDTMLIMWTYSNISADMSKVNIIPMGVNNSFLGFVGYGLKLDETFGLYLSLDNTDEYIPTQDYNPATKKYIDDSIANIKTEIPDISELAEKSEIPTKVSQLDNDENYISMTLSSPDLIKYVWRGSYDQYNALSVHDNTTLYLIKEEE